MKKTPINPSAELFPEEVLKYVGKELFDSSCSAEARVYYSSDNGLFIKRSPKGSLKNEAEMTRYFHSKGLGAEVIDYISADRDWLVTSAVQGEDLTHISYLSRPEWLSDALASTLRELHSLEPTGCPVQNRNADYVAAVNEGYKTKRFDPSFFDGNADMDTVYGEAARSFRLLDGAVLLHGDYCLPNVIFHGDAFSGFIDLGNGGVGDRHIDIFWGIWTLEFNLGTDKYRSRFIDAYGRELVDPERLRLISACECFG